MIQIITIIAVGTLWAASLAVVVFEIIIPSRTINPAYELSQFTQDIPKKMYIYNLIYDGQKLFNHHKLIKYSYREALFLVVLYA